ncbi:hypothetical protein ACQY0O_001890 [Thecaphora frezii]|nr:putative ectomycorrhiza-regulated esterase [Thecaphora frezii]
MRETKLHIPLVLSDRTVSIVGILAQKDLPVHPHTSSSHTYPLDPISRRTTQSRKIAIIVHGLLAHKDQTYHRLLAASLPLDSFRFDFRANAETPGEWNMASFDQDLVDLGACIDYLRNQLGYVVEVIIAHSRGALDGFKFFATRLADEVDASLRVPYYVALSARWRMHKIHGTLRRSAAPPLSPRPLVLGRTHLTLLSRLALFFAPCSFDRLPPADRDPIYLPAFAAEGFYRWKVKVAGQAREVRVYPSDVDTFANFPIQDHVARFPTQTDVLLIQGTKDQTVPVSDAGYYINALTSPPRRPGSATLHLLDDADHNYKQKYPELVHTIAHWLQQKLDDAKQGRGAGAIRDRQLAGRDVKQRL